MKSLFFVLLGVVLVFFGEYLYLSTTENQIWLDINGKSLIFTQDPAVVADQVAKQKASNIQREELNKARQAEPALVPINTAPPAAPTTDTSKPAADPKAPATTPAADGKKTSMAPMAPMSSLETQRWNALHPKAAPEFAQNLKDQKPAVTKPAVPATEKPANTKPKPGDLNKPNNVATTPADQKPATVSAPETTAIPASVKTTSAEKPVAVVVYKDLAFY